jgi:hypothetical protein
MELTCTTIEQTFHATLQSVHVAPIRYSDRNSTIGVLLYFSQLFLHTESVCRHLLWAILGLNCSQALSISPRKKLLCTYNAAN